jgi:hypothetical protein
MEGLEGVFVPDFETIIDLLSWNHKVQLAFVTALPFCCCHCNMLNGVILDRICTPL